MGVLSYGELAGLGAEAGWAKAVQYTLAPWSAATDYGQAKEATKGVKLAVAGERVKLQQQESAQMHEAARAERAREAQREFEGRSRRVRELASQIDDSVRAIRALYEASPGLSPEYAQAVKGYEEAFGAVMGSVVHVQPGLDLFVAANELGNAEWALAAILKEVAAIRERATAESQEITRLEREARIAFERETELRAQAERRRRDEEVRAAAEAEHARRRAAQATRLREIEVARRRREEEAYAREQEARATEEARYEAFIRSMSAR